MTFPSPPSQVERIRAGDLRAFEELYVASFPGLCRFAQAQGHSREGAEEIVQDVFVTIWTRRREIAVDGTLDGYLYGAVRRRALMVRRHEHVVERTRTLVFESSEGVWRGSTPDDPVRSVLREEARSRLAEAIEALDERSRLAITLRWNHGLDYRSIGEALEISPDAARMQVSRAQLVLRRLLTEMS
jgi:RNA polymerase sigma-70 factor, ECF subfamily